MRLVRRPAFAAAALIVGLPIPACSSGAGDVEADAGPVTVRITVQGGNVDPSGDTVEVEQGQDITLLVSSDAEDEIHVHSEPEHEFEVKAEDDQRFTFSIDDPGTYEVESHELEVVIVKLQVS